MTIRAWYISRASASNACASGLKMPMREAEAKPVERPFGGRLSDGKAIHGFADFGGWIRKAAAHERLHDNDGEAFCGGQLQTTRSGLVLDVHIVVLNLTEGP